MNMELSEDDQKIIDEALATWQPWWRKPINPTEWDKLVSQHGAFALSSCESYETALDINAPRFLTQMIARNRYKLVSRYARTRRRAEREKARWCNNLLHALGLKIDTN